jgi:hypothetical protein
MANLPPDRRSDVPTYESSGWLVFAAIMLVIGGAMKVFDAFWAFKYDDDIAEDVQTIVFERDPATWGWIWMAVGILLIVAGFYVITGARWARWIGIVAASITAIAVFPWIYYQPLWTSISVALMVVTIAALATDGGPRGA